MAKSIFGLFQTVQQEEPLANVKWVRRWSEKLPANDPMSGLIAMVHLLEENAKQPAVTADRILAVLELDRLSLPLQAHLQVQYRSPALSDEVRQQLWYGRNDLARWLAYAYEQLYEGIRNQPEDPKVRGQLHGIFSRMFHYRGVQARQGLFRYEQWIPARWKFLHGAYKEASGLGIATLPFSLMENSRPGDRFSTEQEYVQFLLLQRINTGNLSVPQIELASQWLHDWAPTLKLSTTPPEGDQHWLLDLGSAGGLVAPHAGQPVGERLYLDITPLRSQLTALMTSMTEQLALDGAKAAGREIKERLALAKRLELLWLPNARLQPRRGERRADQRALLVAPGWTGIALLMRETNPWKPHDPYSYTYDDAAQLATLGRAHAAKKDSSTIKNNLHPDRRGWEVLDTSESGCRIQSATRDAAQLQIGSLLGLLLEGDNRWRVGIVRRLKRRTADHTELGIEIIAENTLVIMAEPVTPGDSGFGVSGVDVNDQAKRFDALYLPPQQRAQITPVRSLVVPAAEFAPGRVLTLRVEGRPSQVRLAVIIEQARDWVWTTFEVMDNTQ